VHRKEIHKLTFRGFVLRQGPFVGKPDLTKVPVFIISKEFSQPIPSDLLKAAKV